MVKGAKVMVVGSTLSDVLEVAKKPTPQQLKEVEEKEIKRESWSQQKQHKKVQRNDALHNFPGEFNYSFYFEVLTYFSFCLFALPLALTKPYIVRYIKRLSAYKLFSC